MQEPNSADINLKEIPTIDEVLGSLSLALGVSVQVVLTRISKISSSNEYKELLSSVEKPYLKYVNELEEGLVADNSTINTINSLNSGGYSLFESRIKPQIPFTNLGPKLLAPADSEDVLVQRGAQAKNRARNLSATFKMLTGDQSLDIAKINSLMLKFCSRVSVIPTSENDSNGKSEIFLSLSNSSHKLWDLERLSGLKSHPSIYERSYIKYNYKGKKLDDDFKKRHESLLAKGKLTYKELVEFNEIQDIVESLSDLYHEAIEDKRDLDREIQWHRNAIRSMKCLDKYIGLMDIDIESEFAISHKDGSRDLYISGDNQIQFGVVLGVTFSEHMLLNDPEEFERRLDELAQKNDYQAKINQLDLVKGAIMDFDQKKSNCDSLDAGLQSLADEANRFGIHIRFVSPLNIIKPPFLSNSLSLVNFEFNRISTILNKSPVSNIDQVIAQRDIVLSEYSRQIDSEKDRLYEGLNSLSNLQSEISSYNRYILNYGGSIDRLSGVELEPYNPQLLSTDTDAGFSDGFSQIRQSISQINTVRDELIRRVTEFNRMSNQLTPVTEKIDQYFSRVRLLSQSLEVADDAHISLLLTGYKDKRKALLSDLSLSKSKGLPVVYRFANMIPTINIKSKKSKQYEKDKEFLSDKSLDPDKFFDKLGLQNRVDRIIDDLNNGYYDEGVFERAITKLEKDVYSYLTVENTLDSNIREMDKIEVRQGFKDEADQLY